MIPFNKPTYVGEELRYIEQAICKDEKISGDGNFTKKCSSVIEGFLNTDATCLLTASCTDALEMSAILINLKLGDEVICPSYTCLLYTSPSPRDRQKSRMPSSA